MSWRRGELEVCLCRCSIVMTVFAVAETGASCLAELARWKDWNRKERQRVQSRLRWQRLRQDPEWYARFKESSRQHMRKLRSRRKQLAGDRPPQQQ